MFESRSGRCNSNGDVRTPVHFVPGARTSARSRSEKYSPVVQWSSIGGSGPSDPGSNPGRAILKHLIKCFAKC